ncbi:MAG: hypothetical protein AAFR96_02245 [Planctomycetota bacterium]
MSSVRLAAIAFVVLLTFQTGCGTSSSRLESEEDAAVESPQPTYDMLYAGAERRIGTLDRLWARSVTSLRYVDAEGERRRDQGEGFFLFERPGSVAVLIGKLGEMYLILGADDARYWWLELFEGRRAYVGETAEAAEASARATGVPVLPSDVLLALDLVRWPEPGSPRVLSVERSSLAGVDASRTAAICLDESGRVRRVHVDTVSLDPVAVEILATDDTLIARSRLSRHGRVLNRVGAPVEPRMPMRAEIDLPEADARIELSLSRAAMDPRRPSDAVFDFAGLLDRYRIDEVFEIRQNADDPRP